MVFNFDGVVVSSGMQRWPVPLLLVVGPAWEGLQAADARKVQTCSLQSMHCLS
jgi:hypothetical protein